MGPDPEDPRPDPWEPEAIKTWTLKRYGPHSMKIWNEHGTKIHVGLYTVIFYKHHA